MRAVLVLALVACSANDDIPAPIVSSVVPDVAPTSSVVAVYGSYFCQRPNTGSSCDPTCAIIGAVHFGASLGTVSTYTDTAIMVEVPAGASGDAPVTVTASGRTSNSVDFTAQ